MPSCVLQHVMQLVTMKETKDEDPTPLPAGALHQSIGGELVMLPSPTPYHQSVSMKLGSALFRFTKVHNLGTVLAAPIDVQLADADMYQPDLLFIAEERRAVIGAQKIEGAPDLVVEILSTASAYFDLKQKKRRYEAVGVSEYWIVDPLEKSIEIYENQEGAFVLADRAEGKGQAASRLLHGFKVDLEEIF